jgi:CheY-like chemotaxis protein
MLRRLLGGIIEIKVDNPSESLWVEADPGMMEQVVMNLCVNARDAMPKGGQLNIQLRAIALGPEATQRQPNARPGHFIRLRVADSGCGMDEATLKRIFEPFFTTKEAGKGTGLGLATVYGIVKQHQGWIEVESVVGQGTAFLILIPASEAAEIKVETAEAQVTKGGRETILLAEDDESVRRLMATSLRRQGYRLIEARDGLEALALWEEHHGRIDLVISDMMMPQGMTGLDLAEQLRTHRPGLPVVISSGYSADLAGTDASQLEGIAFLPKPCPPATLVQTVRQCLDQAAAHAQKP